MLMTTGSGFEGYRVEKYLGVISKEIIFRSGLGSSLGAAFENFVRAFNFRDVELTGSTELIANAKKYLMEQFEREARANQANAVLGVDIETSFGTDVARVAVSGTAVFVVSENSASVEAVPDENRVIDIRATNVFNPFVASCIELNAGISRSTAAIQIIQTEKGALGDIKADLTIRNCFDDEITIENVCFLNIRQKSGKRFFSSPYPIALPEHISCCVKSCDIVIKKYLHDGKLCFPETLEKIEKNPQQAEISRTLGAEDVYERLSQLKSAKEMLDALNEMDLDPEREPYLTISKTLHSRWNIERVYGGDIQGTLKILRRNIDEII